MDVVAFDVVFDLSLLVFFARVDLALAFFTVNSLVVDNFFGWTLDVAVDVDDEVVELRLFKADFFTTTDDE